MCNVVTSANMMLCLTVILLMASYIKEICCFHDGPGTCISSPSTISVPTPTNYTTAMLTTPAHTNSPSEAWGMYFNSSFYNLNSYAVSLQFKTPSFSSNYTGLLVYAYVIVNNTKVNVGTWLPTPGVTTLGSKYACPGDVTVLSHVSSVSKFGNLVHLWIPPTKLIGNIRISAVLVDRTSNYSPLGALLREPLMPNPTPSTSTTTITSPSPVPTTMLTPSFSPSPTTLIPSPFNASMAANATSYANASGYYYATVNVNLNLINPYPYPPSFQLPLIPFSPSLGSSVVSFGSPFITLTVVSAMPPSGCIVDGTTDPALYLGNAVLVDSTECSIADKALLMSSFGAAMLVVIQCGVAPCLISTSPSFYLTMNLSLPIFVTSSSSFSLSEIFVLGDMHPSPVSMTMATTDRATLPSDVAALRELARHLTFPRDEDDTWFVGPAKKWSDLITDENLDPCVQRLRGVWCVWGRVTQIIFPQWSVFSSQLPAALGSLSALTLLDMSGCSIQGTLPSEVFQIQTLRSILMSNNAITGNLPNNVWMNALINLDLSENLLGGTIPEVFASCSLSVLNLASNNLTGTVPNSFIFMQNLSSLDLSRNSLTSFSSSFSLSSPSSSFMFLSSLSHLQSLSISYNQFTSMSTSSLSQATALVYLTASHNQFQTVSVDLSLLPHLVLVDFSFNRLTSLPILSQPQSLQSVRFQFNQITGTLSSSFRLTGIVDLNLSNNKLFGTIPSDTFDDMSLLTSINLANNRFSGSIPNFQKSALITAVDLSGNSFTGAILPDTSRFPSLLNLNLEFNALTSLTIFTPLSVLCPALLMLDISHNNIVMINNQDFGLWLRSLPSFLTYLDASFNNWNTTFVSPPYMLPLTSLLISSSLISSFDGDLVFGQFQQLKTIDLSNNSLRGNPLPRSPPLNIQFAYFHQNAAVEIPSLPSWLSTDDASTFTKTSPTALFTCPTFFGLRSSSSSLLLNVSGLAQTDVFTVTIDPVATNYDGCLCDRGTFGSPPFCSQVPNSVLLENNLPPWTTLPSFATSTPLSTLSNFTDGVYGSQRLSLGMDLTWTIDSNSLKDTSESMLKTYAIHIIIEFNRSEFIHTSDILDVYQGGPLLDGLLISHFRGSDVTLPDFVELDVIADIATVNFRTRDSSGKHVVVYYALLSFCPSPYTLHQDQCILSPNIFYMIVFIVGTIFVLILIFVVGFLVHRTLSLKRKLKEIARASSKVSTEDKWRNKIVRDMVKEGVSMTLDIASTISSFTVMVYLIEFNADAMSQPFIDGYIISFVSSTASLCISFYFRIKKMITLFTEWKSGVPTYDHNNENQKHANTSTDNPSKVLRVDDPRVQLSSVQRELSSLRLIVFSTLFSTLPYFAMNHILLFSPPALSLSDTTSSLYFSIFLTYTLLGFKISQVLEWRVLINQRDDLTFTVKGVDRRSRHPRVRISTEAASSPIGGGEVERGGEGGGEEAGAPQTDNVRKHVENIEFSSLQGLEHIDVNFQTIVVDRRVLRRLTNSLTQGNYSDLPQICTDLFKIERDSGKVAPPNHYRFTTVSE